MVSVTNEDGDVMYEGGKKKGKDEGGFLEMIGLSNKNKTVIEDNVGVDWHMFNQK